MACNSSSVLIPTFHVLASSGFSSHCFVFHLFWVVLSAILLTSPPLRRYFAPAWSMDPFLYLWVLQSESLLAPYDATRVSPFVSFAEHFLLPDLFITFKCRRSSTPFFLGVLTRFKRCQPVFCVDFRTLPLVKVVFRQSAVQDSFLPPPPPPSPLFFFLSISCWFLRFRSNFFVPKSVSLFVAKALFSNPQRGTSERSLPALISFLIRT